MVNIFDMSKEDFEKLYGKFETIIMEYLSAKLLEYRDQGFLMNEQYQSIVEYEKQMLEKRKES